MLSQPHLAAVSTSGNPHLFHVIERAPLLPLPNGSINVLHADIVDFDPDGRESNARSGFVVEEPFDPSQLDVAEYGALVVVRYKGEFLIAVRNKNGDLDGLEGSDWLISTVAAGIRRVA